MKLPSNLILPLLLCLAPAARGQDIAPKDLEREFALSVIDGAEGENGESPAAADIGATVEAPLLVTGRPPEDAEFLQPSEAPGTPAAEPEGVIVRVEPGTAGAPPIDASKVKLLAPFPAKPLFPPPAGWRLEHPESAPPFVREVTLDNGTRISLTIRPHLLVPGADGDRTIAVSEPGYEAGLQYAQARTIGAVLSDSIQRLDEDALRLGDAIERLEQLLGSLPHSGDSPAGSNHPDP